ARGHRRRHRRGRSRVSAGAGGKPGRAGGKPGLEDAVLHAKVLVTTGSGGVGKTTTAAALGVAAARAGRRTLVLTIDPARRLAQAMGLDHLDDTPRRVPLDGLDGGGGDGQLWAMMLDMQTTFDRLVDTHAHSSANAKAVK